MLSPRLLTSSSLNSAVADINSLDFMPTCAGFASVFISTGSSWLCLENVFLQGMRVCVCDSMGCFFPRLGRQFLLDVGLP